MEEESLTSVCMHAEIGLRNKPIKVLNISYVSSLVHYHCNGFLTLDTSLHAAVCRQHATHHQLGLLGPSMLIISQLHTGIICPLKSMLKHRVD